MEHIHAVVVHDGIKAVVSSTVRIAQYYSILDPSHHTHTHTHTHTNIQGREESHEESTGFESCSSCGGSSLRHTIHTPEG